MHMGVGYINENACNRMKEASFSYFSTACTVDIEIFVCMNAYILETLETRSTKFGGYMSYYCKQIK